MTLLQIVQNVYEALGEPSDLQYLDDNDVVMTDSVGWHRMVDAVNTAMLEICVWKFPDGRTIRFRMLEDVTYLNALVANATVVADVTSSVLVNITATSPSADAFAGAALKVGNLLYKVRYSRINLIDPLTTDVMLDTAVTLTAGTAVTISKREYHFEAQTLDPFVTAPVNIAYNAANGAPLEITNIYDMATNSELGLIKKYDPLVALQAIFQMPSQFYKLAGGLRFESFPDAVRTYAVRYMRGPRVLDYLTLDGVPELPIQFHEAIVLHALWWGYRRMQENNSAYSVRNELMDMLRRVRTEYDLQGELTSHQFTLTSGV